MPAPTDSAEPEELVEAALHYIGLRQYLAWRRSRGRPTGMPQPVKPSPRYEESREWAEPPTALPELPEEGVLGVPNDQMCQCVMVVLMAGGLSAAEITERISQHYAYDGAKRALTRKVSAALGTLKRKGWAIAEIASNSMVWHLTEAGRGARRRDKDSNG